MAAAQGHLDTVRLLVEGKGAELEARDDDGKTALVWAAANGHVATLDYLLSKGARRDGTDGRGRPAISWAAQNGFHDAVELLLARSADAASQDLEGATPMTLAAVKSRWQVVSVLERHGVSVPRAYQARLLEFCSAVRAVEASSHYLPERGSQVAIPGAVASDSAMIEPQERTALVPSTVRDASDASDSADERRWSGEQLSWQHTWPRVEASDWGGWWGGWSSWNEENRSWKSDGWWSGQGWYSGSSWQDGFPESCRRSWTPSSHRHL
eukprot:gnl/TRDRNA2_/TRDRNA2_142291_c0_seq1.p1 gnl/TRDRNA2_/TRDRNA2_142291_c0~~gnl/TRDRNA2_/TRDRNA2_142291_c0_seq1.p1  ORF type:complete len:291 (+),score=38.08 gnl/TRDRNA2_/TRDRNA2_142291_c0_seq1:71-874(+)